MESSESRTWYIYCHTAPNGKRYIGQTCVRPERRWGKGYKGCTYIEHAIAKYGWDSFEHSILAVCHSKQMADLLETNLIAFFDTTNPDRGYNILNGGGGRAGFAVSQEVRDKISKSLTGRKGHRPSDEQRKRMSEAQKASYKNGTRKRFEEYPEEMQDRLRQLLVEEGRKHSRPVVQFDSEGNQLAVFPSAAEAQRKTGTFSSGITYCCQGVHKKANGYVWRYLDQPETFPPQQVGLFS